MIMNRVSIFEKKWLDVIFEGKNQKYGAYQLRRENEKTTLIAFFTGIGLLSGSVFLLSSFNVKPIPEPVVCPIDTTLVVVDIAPLKDPVGPKGSETPKAPENPVKNFKPVAPAEVPKDPEPKEPTAPVVDPVPGIPDGSGTPGGTPGGVPGGTPGGSDGGVLIPEAPPTTIEVSTTLDEQPEFPGGMQRFYKEVVDRFDEDVIEDLEGETRKVLVTFVIERNGAMTDISVIRNADPTVDQEAIRALKAIPIKWKAGIKNGKTVRTRYSLPILIKN
jgi:protein TonB